MADVRDPRDEAMDALLAVFTEIFPGEMTVPMARGYLESVRKAAYAYALASLRAIHDDLRFCDCDAHAVVKARIDALEALL